MPTLHPYIVRTWLLLLFVSVTQARLQRSPHADSGWVVAHKYGNVHTVLTRSGDDTAVMGTCGYFVPDRVEAAGEGGAIVPLKLLSPYGSATVGVPLLVSKRPERVCFVASAWADEQGGLGVLCSKEGLCYMIARNSIEFEEADVHVDVELDSLSCSVPNRTSIEGDVVMAMTGRLVSSENVPRVYVAHRGGTLTSMPVPFDAGTLGPISRTLSVAGEAPEIWSGTRDVHDSGFAYFGTPTGIVRVSLLLAEDESVPVDFFPLCGMTDGLAPDQATSSEECYIVSLVDDEETDRLYAGTCETAGGSFRYPRVFVLERSTMKIIQQSILDESFTTSSCISIAHHHTEANRAIFVVNHFGSTFDVADDGYSLVEFDTRNNGFVVGDTFHDHAYAVLRSVGAEAASAFLVVPQVHDFGYVFLRFDNALHLDNIAWKSVWFGCPPGEAGALPDAPCVECITGSYSSGYGADMCPQCPFNSFANTTGQVACELCPENSAVGFGGGTARRQCVCEEGCWTRSEETGTVCERCLENSLCSGELARPAPLPGYWIDISLPRMELTAALKCTPYDACLGGAGSQCLSGYSGRQCGRCATGFYRNGEHCFECPDDHGMVVLAFGLFMLVLFAILFRFTRKASQLSFIGSVFGYIQLTSVFVRLHLDWPDALAKVLSTLSVMNFNLDVTHSECQGLGYTEKWFLSMSLPIFAFMILVGLALLAQVSNVMYRGCHFVVTIFRSKRSKFVEEEGNFFDTGMNAFCMFLTLSYLYLSLKVLEIFDCSKQPDGKSTLDVEPAILCYTRDGPWSDILPWAVFFLIVYVIGIPATFLIILMRNRERIYLGDRKFLARYGSLFLRYRPSCYMWEIIVMIRKLFTVVIIFIFFTNSPILQAGLTLLLMSLVVLVHVSFSPFVIARVNTLEMLLMSVSWMVLVSGILFRTDDFPNDDVRTFVSGVVTVLLGGSLVSIVWLFLLEVGRVCHHQKMTVGTSDRLTKEARQMALSTFSEQGMPVVEHFASVSTKYERSQFYKMMKGIANEANTCRRRAHAVLNEATAHVVHLMRPSAHAHALSWLAQGEEGESRRFRFIMGLLAGQVQREVNRGRQHKDDDGTPSASVSTVELVPASHDTEALSPVSFASQRT